jgi:hypothetical protein
MISYPKLTTFVYWTIIVIRIFPQLIIIVALVNVAILSNTFSETSKLTKTILTEKKSIFDRNSHRLI